MACRDKTGDSIVAGDSCTDARLGTTVTVGAQRNDIGPYQFRDTAGIIHRGRDCTDNS